MEISTIDQGLEQITRDSFSYFKQAEAHYLAQQDELALNAYLKSLALANETDWFLFEIYKNMGNIFVRAGDFDAAEENYNRAYTIDPSSDALMVNYGILEIQRDNSEAAIERFRQAVLLNCRNDKAWVGLALVHRRMADFDLAWANLVQAVDLNPDNETALGLVGQWAVRDGRLTEAMAIAEATLARKQSPAAWKLYDTIDEAKTNRLLRIHHGGTDD